MVVPFICLLLWYRDMKYLDHEIPGYVHNPNKTISFILLKRIITTDEDKLHHLLIILNSSL